MKIAVWAGHVGSHGLKPSGQHGGGELHTFATLQLLNKHYDVTAIVRNGVYPAFDQAGEYGFDLSGLNWSPVGDNIEWLRAFDVLVNISHSDLCPPICRRNILVPFFPQYPDWDVSGYDTILAISKFTAKWVKGYWGRDADVFYPPVPVTDIMAQTKDVIKSKDIVSVGRFFDVPGGNNKKHLTMLHSFQDLMRPDWQLTFIGAVQNSNYYGQIRQQVGDDRRIRFLHDLDRATYLKTIAESAFVWSATGFEATKPSSKEHYGVFVVEGMATGAIPLVHNSGGPPELGAITWETPRDLVEKTNALIGDFERLSSVSAQMMKNAQKFGLGPSEKRLVDLIEKPIAIKNREDQFKIFLPDLTPTDIKVGVISDGAVTTGFGTVSRAVVTGLLKRGFQVAWFGIQDPYMGKTRLTTENIRQIVESEFREGATPTSIMSKIEVIEPCTIWRGCEHDHGGWNNLGRFLSEEKPDVLYINYDPGNIKLIIDTLRQTEYNAPMVVYMPIEGTPVIEQYIETIRLVRVLNGQTIVYTKTGVEAVEKASGPKCKWVHHGIDHAPFKPLSPEEKQKLRFAVGWQNKTVLMTVGRNKRTKGFSTVLDTAKLLKDSGFNFVWYCHTNPHERMQNSSMPLDQMAMQRGVDDVVIFAPDLTSQLSGPPYDIPPHIGPVPDTDDIREVWRHNLSALSMIERYGAADIYVNLSELEGFGLPPMEAAGCGVPVISVDDKGVQREVLGAAPVYIPVSHWDGTWHTGARLAQVNPGDVARAIVDVSADPKLMAELSKASLKRYQELTWDKAVDALAAALMEQVI